MEVHRTFGFDKSLALFTLVLVAARPGHGLQRLGRRRGREILELARSLRPAGHRRRGRASASILVLLTIRRPFYEHAVFVIGLLVLTVVLLGLCFLMPTVAKTNRWIVVPGFRFQPSELAKISLVLFLAWYLDRQPGPDPRDQAAPPSRSASSLFVVVLILREPDFGTAVLTFGLCMILLLPRRRAG